MTKACLALRSHLFSEAWVFSVPLLFLRKKIEFLQPTTEKLDMNIKNLRLLSNA
ncbi:hypothetical protein BofuT4_uP102880.1 [Botrytis cinerea T4]|uniref:Uncharacterized protein n=1 Tax=Botryotinia fuckeliana (strain T4) TaxID=999810 RepID=G2YBA2_BOTF4|nr:hypothetical protein BofuT4_uP102880.1 [Botrytis cinerea T4]